MLRRRGAAGFGSAGAACGRAARSAGELHVAQRRQVHLTACAQDNLCAYMKAGVITLGS